jgi:hypothetical protein
MKRIAVVQKCVVLAVLLLSAPHVYAASHAITPSGSGTKSGADWNNACAGFTGNCATTGTTGMVRGDIYYVAGGQYSVVGGSNQIFDVADSASLTIEIRGATAADHGPATGWVAGFDVNTAPARIVPSLTYVNNTTGNNTTIWRITSSNWTINGNNCTANQVRQFGQGIMIDDSQSAPGLTSIQSSILINPTEAVNLTLLCVEFKGYGLSSSLGNSAAPTSISCSNGVVTATFGSATRFFGPDSTQNRPGSQIAITGVSGGSGFNLAQAVVTGNPTASSITYNSPGCSGSGTGGTIDGVYNFGVFPIFQYSVAGNIVIRYCSIHDTNNPMHLRDGSTSHLFEYNFVGRWFGNSTFHSEAFSWQGCVGSGFTGTTIRYNYLLDGESSGVFVPLNGACMSELDIYGNVVANTSGNPYLRSGYGDGVFDCINHTAGTTCTNVQIYNNTFANIKGTSPGKSGVQVETGISNSTWRVEDNLWYNDDPMGMSPGMGTEDYNTLLNTSQVGGAGLTGAHDFSITGATDPFNADTATKPVITGFELKSETVDAHLNDGVSTASFFPADETDYNRKTRGSDGTWERGAFEF